MRLHVYSETQIGSSKTQSLSSEKYLGQSLESAATTAGMKGVSSAPLDTRCAGILLLYL